MLPVEAVSWLPSGKHHIVRDIHGKIDGTHPDAPDQALELKGRGDVFDILYHKASVTGTALRILYLDLQLLSHAGELSRLDRLQRALVNGGKLARHSIVAPQVGAVRHRFVVYLKNDVVKAQSFGERRARFRLKIAEIHYL